MNVIECGLPKNCPWSHPPGTSYHSWQIPLDQVEFIVNMCNALTLQSHLSLQVFWDWELCIDILKFLAIQMYNKIIYIQRPRYHHYISPKCSDEYTGLWLFFCFIKKLCIVWKFGHTYPSLSPYSSSLGLLNLLFSQIHVLFLKKLIVHWVWLVLLRFEWVRSHPLAHGWPTSVYICKQKWFIILLVGINWQ